MGIKGSALVPKRKNNKPEILFLEELSRELGGRVRALVSDRIPGSTTGTSAAFEWREAGPTRRRSLPLVVVGYLGEIRCKEAQELKEMGRADSRYLFFVGDTPIESVHERLVGLDVRTPHRMHVARASNRSEQIEMMTRLISCLASGTPEDRILDAWWESECLVVLSASYERLRVPKTKLERLAQDAGRTAAKQWSRFQIHPDGAYIHWPAFDVHMSWESLVQLVDDAARLKASQRSEEFNRRYGAALRALREKAELTQGEIGELTARHVRRIESGTQRATAHALREYSAALDSSVADLMRELAGRATQTRA